MQLSHELLNMYQYVLMHEKQDKSLLAEMLSLPSEKYIGEQMDVIDVEAIHRAREFARRQIAQFLEPILLKTYHLYCDTLDSHQFNQTEVAKRQLKNCCLSYLMLLPSHLSLGIQQIEKSLTRNMTDTQSALVALANLDVPERKQALDQFYAYWQQDALVVDKWLSIQAASPLPTTLNQVQELSHHEAFDLKNPNKVYALIGTFGAHNPINFHRKDGEGYIFLREIVQQLDTINPQVAARMTKPLTTWKRYDKERQTLMREQLVLLAQTPKLSIDLYELITKSLAHV